MKLNIEVQKGTTDSISYSGKRLRRNTMLLKVGSYSISKRAFQLGLLLIIAQFLDGLLTYIGLSIFGVRMEGNNFLKFLMKTYGSFPALFATKAISLCLAVFLTVFAHRRYWIRSLIVVLCVVYLVLAIWPWTYIISARSL